MGGSGAAERIVRSHHGDAGGTGTASWQGKLGDRKVYRRTEAQQVLPLHAGRDAGGSARAVNAGPAGDGRAVAAASRRRATWPGTSSACRSPDGAGLFSGPVEVGRGHAAGGGPVASSGRDGTTEYGLPIQARQVRPIAGKEERMAAAGQRHARWIPPPQPCDAPWFVLKLAREINWAAKNGYLDRLVLERGPESPPPMPPQAFLAVMEAYNIVMDDLQRRFPKIREIRPPNLSQNDLGAESLRSLGRYRLDSSTMQFTNPFSIHWGRYSEDRKNDSLTSPKLKGFEGVVLHEYAHHLRTQMLPDRRRWLTGLAAMLKENGFVDDESKIDITPAFAIHIGKKAREMGLGYYAGRNAEEFTAESLAWRLSPGYGASAATPGMPRYLENWIHECFPFTLDGPGPGGPFAFDPAGIREPWMKNGQVRWHDRGPAPTPPPRDVSMRRSLS